MKTVNWSIDWTLGESQHDSLLHLQGDSRPMCALAYIAVSFCYNLFSNLMHLIETEKSRWTWFRWWQFISNNRIQIPYNKVYVTRVGHLLVHKLHFPRFPDHWNFDWIQNSQLLLLEYKSSLSEHSDAVNSLLSKFKVDMLWKAICLFKRARGVFKAIRKKLEKRSTVVPKNLKRCRDNKKIITLFHWPSRSLPFCLVC